MSDYQTYDLGDFKLQNGETIPGAFIGKHDLSSDLSSSLPEESKPAHPESGF